MALSPLENPVTYRDREMVRKLSPLYEKAIRNEALYGVPCGAADIFEAMNWHLSRAVQVEQTRRAFMPGLEELEERKP